jgi:hypothetical protein
MPAGSLDGMRTRTRSRSCRSEASPPRGASPAGAPALDDGGIGPMPAPARASNTVRKKRTLEFESPPREGSAAAAAGGDDDVGSCIEYLGTSTRDAADSRPPRQIARAAAPGHLTWDEFFGHASHYGRARAKGALTTGCRSGAPPEVLDIIVRRTDAKKGSQKACFRMFFVRPDGTPVSARSMPIHEWRKKLQLLYADNSVAEVQNTLPAYLEAHGVEVKTGSDVWKDVHAMGLTQKQLLDVSLCGAHKVQW